MCLKGSSPFKLMCVCVGGGGGGIRGGFFVVVLGGIIC